MLITPILLLSGAALLGGRVVLARRRSAGAPSASTADVPPEPDRPEPSRYVPLDADFEAEISAVDRDLALSAAASATAGVGMLIASPIGVLAVPLLAVPLATLGRISWADLRQNGRLSLGGLQSIGGVLAIATGHVGLCAVGTAAFIGGKRLQLATRRRTRDALAGSLGNWVEAVWVVRDGVEVEVALDDVRPGEHLDLQAGQPIPCDGIMVEGSLIVDQRMLTGESALAEKVVGDRVFAATLAVGGHARIEVERAGESTLAARLGDLIASTESHEQSVEAEIESMANATVAPSAVMAGLGAMRGGALGGLAGLWSNCIEVAWLTAPLEVLASTRAAARSGLLIKDGRSLELVPTIDTVVLDKTGTLTLDQMEVTGVYAEPGFEEHDLLRLAAAAEARQSHPIAAAIVDAARLAGAESRSDIRDVVYDTGFGLRARIDGRAVVIGSLRLLERVGVTRSADFDGFVQRADTRGRSVVGITCDGRLAGCFELAPVVRPEARRIIEALSRRGLSIEILTGDDPGPTRSLAASLGIERWRASMLPEDKSRHIAALVERGRRVCFVGDGVNDALAMRHAQLSVSMSGASAIALDSAQVILRDGSLRHLDALFELGERHARSQRRIAVAALAPTLISFGGVMFAGFGPAAPLVFYGLGLGGGLGIALGQARWQPAELGPSAETGPSSPR